MVWWCHVCQAHLANIVYDPVPACPRCRSDFVEEIEAETDIFENTQNSPNINIHNIFQMMTRMVNLPAQSQARRINGNSTGNQSENPQVPENTRNEDDTNYNLNQEPRVVEITAGANGQRVFELREILGFIGSGLTQSAHNDGEIGPDTMMGIVFNALQIPTVQGGISGDYVFSQQGIDDIITRMMEQAGSREGPVPASDEMISELPDTPYLETESTKECPICQEDFEIGKGVVPLPCKHIFHHHCITTWLKRNGTCPVCRCSLLHPEQSSPESHEEQATPASHVDEEPLD